jgi:hypothetical protein
VNEEAYDFWVSASREQETRFAQLEPFQLNLSDANALSAEVIEGYTACNQIAPWLVRCQL